MKNEDRITELIYKRIDNINAIKKAKEELSKTDYKVIKCMEAQLENTELPYDKDELLRTRKELREVINSNESEQDLLHEEVIKLIEDKNK